MNHAFSRFHLFKHENIYIADVGEYIYINGIGLLEKSKIDGISLQNGAKDIDSLNIFENINIGYAVSLNTFNEDTKKENSFVLCFEEEMGEVTSNFVFMSIEEIIFGADSDKRFKGRTGKKEELPKSTDKEVEDIEIQYLPTLGKAYSTKTIKQGRRHSYRDEEILDDIGSGIHKAGHQGRKELAKMNLNGMKVLCGRIIRFRISSDKQREVARSLLEYLNSPRQFNEEERETMAYLCRIVIRIDKDFRYRYKNKYKEC